MADVLKVLPLARIRLTRNGSILHNQSYAPTERTFTEEAGARVVLGTNQATFQEFDLESIAVGSVLIVKTDRPIKIAIDTVAQFVKVGGGDSGVGPGALFLDEGSFSHVFFKNESVSNKATVTVLALTAEAS